MRVKTGQKLLKIPFKNSISDPPPVARFTQALLEKSRSKVEILQRLNSAESEATAKARSEVAALQNRPVHRSKLPNSRTRMDFFSFKGGGEAVRYYHKGRVKR
jgi:hypothetical protein